MSLPGSLIPGKCNLMFKREPEGRSDSPLTWSLCPLTDISVTLRSEKRPDADAICPCKTIKDTTSRATTVNSLTGQLLILAPTFLNDPFLFFVITVIKVTTIQHILL